MMGEGETEDDTSQHYPYGENLGVYLLLMNPLLQPTDVARIIEEGETLAANLKKLSHQPEIREAHQILEETDTLMASPVASPGPFEDVRQSFQTPISKALVASPARWSSPLLNEDAWSSESTAGGLYSDCLVTSGEKTRPTKFNGVNNSRTDSSKGFESLLDHGAGNLNNRGSRNRAGSQYGSKALFHQRQSEWRRVAATNRPNRVPTPNVSQIRSDRSFCPPGGPKIWKEQRYRPYWNNSS
jgi:hypothetical protein